MKHRSLTFSIATAIGLGLAGNAIAGSGYGHSAANSGSEAASVSSGYESASQASDASGNSGFESQDSRSQASSDFGASASSGQAAATESSVRDSMAESQVPVEVTEPSLVFSDGQWYSYSDGAWYALEDGEWQILGASDPYAFEAMSDYGTATDPYGYPYDGSTSEAPYYQVTLYSTDGLEWYSDDGEHVVSWTPVAIVDADSAWAPTAALSDSSGSTRLR